MRTFVRVVERGNFSQVAREMEVAQPSVTRHMKELEEALNVSLLKRTTRQISVTEEGERFYQRCVQILQLVEDASQEVQRKKSELKGRIHLSCTTAFGVQYLCPILHEFLALHPEVELDINLTDDRIDLIAEGVDFVIRLAPLANSSLKYRKLGDSERLLAASPEFVAQYGPIDRPDDLAPLEAIRVCRVSDSKQVRLFKAEGGSVVLPLTGRFVIDNGLAAKDALVSGRGFGVTNRWLVQDLLDSGKLVQLLPDYTLEPIPLSLLIAPERADITRVRYLIEYIVREVQKIPGIF